MGKAIVLDFCDFSNVGLGTVTPSIGIGTKYMISVSSSDTRMGAVAGAGEYPKGTVVQISATPKAGFKFVRWQDGNTENPRKVVADREKTYTATFATTLTPFLTIDNKNPKATAVILYERRSDGTEQQLSEVEPGKYEPLSPDSELRLVVNDLQGNTGLTYSHLTIGDLGNAAYTANLTAPRGLSFRLRKADDSYIDPQITVYAKPDIFSGLTPQSVFVDSDDGEDIRTLEPGQKLLLDTSDLAILQDCGAGGYVEDYPIGTKVSTTPSAVKIIADARGAGSSAFGTGFAPRSLIMLRPTEGRLHHNETNDYWQRDYQPKYKLPGQEGPHGTAVADFDLRADFGADASKLWIQNYETSVDFTSTPRCIPVPIGTRRMKVRISGYGRRNTHRDPNTGLYLDNTICDILSVVHIQLPTDLGSAYNNSFSGSSYGYTARIPNTAVVTSAENPTPWVNAPLGNLPALRITGHYDFSLDFLDIRNSNEDRFKDIIGTDGRIQRLLGSDNTPSGKYCQFWIWTELSNSAAEINRHVVSDDLKNDIDLQVKIMFEG